MPKIFQRVSNLDSGEKFALLLFSFVVLIFTLFLSTQGENCFKNDFVERPIEEPHIRDHYNPETEKLTINVVNGSFTKLSGEIKITNSNMYLEEKPSENRYLIGSGEDRKNTSYWVKTGNFGLGSQGVAEFPVDKNSSLEIFSDGTDRDNDGIKGIENQESVYLNTRDESGELVPVYKFQVANNDSTGFRGKPLFQPQRNLTKKEIQKYTTTGNSTIGRESNFNRCEKSIF
jgi:hypothetical protein